MLQSRLSPGPSQAVDAKPGICVGDLQHCSGHMLQPPASLALLGHTLSERRFLDHVLRPLHCPLGQCKADDKAPQGS
jgi:hypothetical protein